MSEELISRDTFTHLVRLAALELDVEEAEYLRGQLNNQLTAIRELAAIPLEEGLLATSHGVTFTPDISPALREDHWLPYENPRGIVEGAPQSRDGYFVVPGISHTTLE